METDTKATEPESESEDSLDTHLLREIRDELRALREGMDTLVQALAGIGQMFGGGADGAQMPGFLGGGSPGG